jgi:hypothetical protein
VCVFVCVCVCGYKSNLSSLTSAEHSGEKLMPDSSDY